MQYAEQPTPPFNSPYQTHTSRADTMLEPPYLSSSRNEAMPNHPQGLGLYNYRHQVPTTLPSSPSSSDSWSGHVSTGTLPPMTQPIADPWSSGAYEHPVARSPQPWNAAQMSPRSSVSSVSMVPVYSHHGTDNTYHEISHGIGAVRLGDQVWTPDARYGHSEPALPSSRQYPLTVAPERLSGSILSYDNAYEPTHMAAPAPEYNDQPSPRRASRETSTGSQSDFPATTVHRQRRGSRKQTELGQAQYSCLMCQKGFSRQYNYKQHMLTHDPNRKKDHVCLWDGCGRSFVRRTDLDRHHRSVHLKERSHKCRNCPAGFARKDTCGRHENDGCHHRRRLSAADPRVSHYRRDRQFCAKL
ncbi:uncharacterized protein EKO05_0009262 [Ascochyta rabiei]|uniref:uncharacterized protein n=1 Tax=Didymella rabiei TaxID=5454 RepID=UPI0018FF9ADD|nr:uncharacterized protein EKO05_0009262 [Ascochyta rabiei]UPX18982.1 hypothetical protein EKO05_0009262 [Ascochyta rabiei]